MSTCTPTSASHDVTCPSEAHRVLCWRIAGACVTSKRGTRAFRTESEVLKSSAGYVPQKPNQPKAMRIASCAATHLPRPRTMQDVVDGEITAKTHWHLRAPPSDEGPGRRRAVGSHSRKVAEPLGRIGRPWMCSALLLL